jgi:DNA polymerase-3 subunit beta
MKFKISVDTLRESINRVLSIVDKKNTRTILTFSQIKVFKDKLEIESTDLEVSCKVVANIKSDFEFSFCINSKNLFDILKELPSGELELSLDSDNNQLLINIAHIHFSLMVLGADQFPNLNFHTTLNNFTIPSKILSMLISRTIHAISNDETRIYLNGIYLQNTDNKLRAVATDGHRLLMQDIDFLFANDQTLKTGLILPRKGINEIKKLIEADPNGEIKFSYDDSFLYASRENEYYLSIRLISRDYVKYQAVIPSKTTFSMKVSKELFLNALKRIKIMSNEKSNGIRINLKQNALILSANHPVLGNASESIGIDYSGKDFEIGFNAKYLIDCISVIESNMITIDFNNELSPIIIKDDTEKNFLGIVMPLKL